MKRPPPYRVPLLHGLKTWCVMIVTFVPLYLIADYLPTWLLNTLFLVLAVFVFFPVLFAVGPLGRRIGRPLNEWSVAQDKAERTALGGSQSAREKE